MADDSDSVHWLARSTILIREPMRSVTGGENAITSFVILFPGQVLVVVARQRSRLERQNRGRTATEASVTGPLRLLAAPR